MWDSVHLVAEAVLGIIALVLLLRQDVINFRLKEPVMTKEWESVLGQMILFIEEEPGRWKWECPTLNVFHDVNVRYSSQSMARLSAAAVIFAFYVTEETTSHPVPPATSSPVAAPPLLPAGPSRPPQGSGGRR